MLYRTHKRRKKGTYMKLTSAERLQTFVLTKKDIDLINAGKSHQVDRRKISQRELADRVGVHRSFINHLTAGRSSTCTPVVADRIAEVLKVDVSVLFDEIAPQAVSQNKNLRESRSGSLIVA